MPRRALPLLLGLVLLAAGCGGPKSYSLAKTRACLAKEKGVRIRPAPRSDVVASVASGGAVLVKLKANQVTLSFGIDQKEADRLATGYRHVAGKNIGIADVLRPDRNAVLLWKQHPSNHDIDLVNGCLR